MFWSVLRLIRLPNLLIIALTMITMRYAVLRTLIIDNALTLELPDIYFIILVTGAVLIAAGGYIINDYFDIDSDTVNKPDRMLVTKVFTPNAVFNAYIVLNVVAFSITAFVSYKLDLNRIFLIYPLSIGILWFYSNTYKSQFFIGNILISCLAGCVTLIPAIYELPLVYKKYQEFIVHEELKFGFLYIPVGIYAIFAFWITLMREITKDIEDIEGDKQTGCKTIPVVIGIKRTKYIILTLGVILLIAIAGLLKLYLLGNTVGKIDYFTLFYFIILIVLPLFVSVYYLIKAKERRDYSISSNMLKLVMIFGILYAWILAI